MKIDEVAFIGYPITDTKRARRFYEEILGMTPSRTFGDDDNAWIEYDLGPTTFAINNVAGENWKPSPDGAAVAFEVVDFDTAVTELKAHNVPFDLEPTDTPACRMAVVSDPDGNKVIVHKRKSQTSPE